MANLPNIDPRLFKVAVGVSAASLLAGGVLWFQGQPTEVDVTQPVVISESEQEAAVLVVHVVGEVKQPGVYDLPANSRVTDAIEAAGGATKEADLTSINLARVLFDGEQIFIGNVNQEASPSTSSSSSASGENPSANPAGRININMASASQLDQLPGIGPVIAGRIVDYRNQNGPFRQLTDLKNVSGIGDAIYDKIKDLITL
jgi:competence protein ComEA